MLIAKCTYCGATLHLTDDYSHVKCSNCGELVYREHFEDDGVFRPEAMNLDVENAKSLRSIAMSLQCFVSHEVGDYDHECDRIGPLDG